MILGFGLVLSSLVASASSLLMAGEENSASKTNSDDKVHTGMIHLSALRPGDRHHRHPSRRRCRRCRTLVSRRHSVCRGAESVMRSSKLTEW